MSASGAGRLVRVQESALKQNDVAAAALRRQFAEAGTAVISLVSSPGSGKTALLEATLERLRDRYRVAALVGDLATDNDSRRLARAGVPVRQINTGDGCHLEAAMVREALRQLEPGPLDFLFIENVGNLVCPAGYDLGERMRVVLLSVTEGDDKPAKYPVIFNTSHLAVITKADLLGFDVGFNLLAARAAVQCVHPGMPVLEVSVRTGQGMGMWLGAVVACLAETGGRRGWACQEPVGPLSPPAAPPRAG